MCIWIWQSGKKEKNKTKLHFMVQFHLPCFFNALLLIKAYTCTLHMLHVLSLHCGSLQTSGLCTQPVCSAFPGTAFRFRAAQLPGV